MTLIKYYFLIILFLFCTRTQSQDLVTVELVSEISQVIGQLLLTSLGINIFLDNGVDVYRVTYTTTGSDMTLDTASGLIMVPDLIEGPLPILVYQHGTTDGREDVPSNLGGAYQLGAIFAGKKMIVVAPDFLGMGTSRGFHPYVHAKTEATATIDLIEAAREFMGNNEISWNDQLLITGYSQGGHAAMAVHQYIEEVIPERYHVTASLPMSGPYSISGVMRNLAFMETAYSFPAYLVYSTRGIKEIDQTLYTDESEIFKNEFLVDINEFVSTGQGLFALNESIVQTLISTYGSSIPKQIFKDSVLNVLETDQEHPFNAALRESDVFDWAPEAPVLMLYCESDDQVPFRNSVIADSVMNLRGAVNTRSMEVSGGEPLDHSDCAIPALNVGIPWLLGFVDDTTPTVEIISESDILIFPNPTDGYLNITSGQMMKRMEIFSLDGKMTLSTEEATMYYSLDLAELQKGIYLVHIYTEKGLNIRKLAVQ